MTARGGRSPARHPAMQSRRRGFVLILVLAMLALIAIIGVAFVRFSDTERKSAEARDQAILHGDTPQKLLEFGLYEVLCGSQNSKSFILGHEICRDLYGNDGQKVLLVAGSNPVNPGTTRLRLRADPDATPLYDLMPLSHFYNGRLLVLTSGRLDGRTVRILGSALVQSAAPVAMDVEVDAPLDLTQLVAGDHAVIVGRPFNGSGAGVYPLPTGPGLVDLNNDGWPDDSASDLDGNGTGDALDGLPDLFTPNLFYAGLRPEMVWNINPTPAYVPIGGFDEDYDYPDFQNMFLAMVRYAKYQPEVFLPSFHRAGMLQKVAQIGIPNYGVPAFDPWTDRLIPGLAVMPGKPGRKMILRPRPIDQVVSPALTPPGPDQVYGTSDDRVFPLPKFLVWQNTVQVPVDVNSLPDLNGNGSADEILAVSQKGVAVDVDNDGDGVLDSIWVDVGRPVQTSADGHRYKVLYAYMILPLDGKLNLNAHGKLDEDLYWNEPIDWDGDGVRDHPAIDRPVADGILTINDRDGWMDSHLSWSPGADGQWGVKGVDDNGNGIVDELGEDAAVGSDDLPVGNGWSVSEINLQVVFPYTVDFVDNDGDGTIDEPDEIRGRGEYMRVLQGRVGDPSNPARPVVPGRWGEARLLWDLNNDGFPDQGVYPRAGATLVPNPGPNPDDDRPGDLYTRLVLQAITANPQTQGNILEGSFVHPGPDGAFGTADDVFPVLYRNPADFDGDGSISFYPPNPANPALDRFHGKGWPVFGPNPNAGPWLMPWAGWGGRIVGLGGALTQYGWPANWNIGEMQGYGENVDSQEEMDLSTNRGGVDDPFGPEDLEWLYLNHDLGGYEPDSRLGQLAPLTFGSRRIAMSAYHFRNRHLVTTDSWDLTSYNIPSGPSASTIGLNLVPPFWPGQGSGHVAAPVLGRLSLMPNIFALLPEEIQAGLRLDLNRPFGDGLDNPIGGNTNGIVDEDLEAGFDGVDNDHDGQVDESVAQVSAGPGYPDLLDNDNDGQFDEPDELIENINGPNNIEHDFDDVPGPRQRMARDLYVLLYFLVSADVGPDGQWGTPDDLVGFTLPPGYTQDAAGRADYLAQLAVNIIDFRDADKIHTGFEYDRFLGLDASGNPPGVGSLVPTWNVDGNLTTDENTGAPVLQRGVVWGVERPDLVVNETLAYYDTMDQAEANQGLGANALDESYLWVELYNPNDPNHPGYPPVDVSSLVPADPAVPLNQKTELWRLVVGDHTGDPADATGLNPLPSTVDGQPNLASAGVQKVVFHGGAAVGIDNQPNAPTTPLDNNGALSSTAPPPITALNGDAYLSVGSVAGPAPDEFPLGTPVPDLLIDRNVTSPAGVVLTPGPIPNTNIGSVHPRGVYLQRLADPTRRWHADANPYVTVDALQVKVYVIDTTDVDPTTMMPPDPQPEAVQSLERLMPYVGRNREVAGAWPDPQGVQDYNNGATQGGHSMPDAAPAPGLDPKTNLHTRTSGPSAGNPFPWFAFNDRPFATPMELFLVPATRMARVTNDFSTAQSTLLLDPYQPNAAGQPRPFPHLIQLFEDNRKPANVAHATPGLYRLLEFVEVPSRQNGVSEVLNPQFFPAPWHFRRAWRVPGKLNVNALFETEPFDALFSYHPAWWDIMWAFNPNQDLRRGPDGLWGTDDDRPYRCYAFGQPQGDIDDTLLRNTQNPPAGGGPPGQIPLFDQRTRRQDVGEQKQSAIQHAAYRYQPLQKIGNTTTTRSNVFAVWVTAGFFEVLEEPVANGIDDDQDGAVDEPDELLPKLGRELGSDVGSLKRHRAFYVIDRSRAIGWHPDASIDPRGMILLERVIE